MGSFQINRATRRMNGVRRAWSTLGVWAIVGLLAVACQAGGSAGSATGTSTAPPTEPSGSSSATPSASATSTAPTVVASPTATTLIVSALDPRIDGFDVTFGEFAITLEADVIRPGPVTFVVHNAGEMTHGFEMKIESSGSGSGSGSGRDRKKIETRTFHSGRHRCGEP